MANVLLNLKSNSRKELLLMTGLVIMIVVITSLQDYYGAKWNDIYYDFYESMAYKLFWLLFIPFYILFTQLTKNFSGKLALKDNRLPELTFRICMPVTMAIIHLFLFAYLLYAISPLLIDEHWNLELLIKEKLTTRLYLVLTVYLVFSYFHYRQERKRHNEPNFNGHLPIKNGGLTTLVKTTDIKWIKADRGYLELQTCDKKYVIVDSLKNVLENLDPGQFKRIHKSTIINLKMIKSFKSRNNGDYDVQLTDGSSFRLSRNYVKPIKYLMS